MVLYGLRLTVQDIGHVGVAGVAIDARVLSSTFALACFIGTRWLGLERKTAMLIGAGSAMCGAGAVMAAEPVVKARAEQVTVAVATVVVFGTLAIFLYPALFELNQHWALIPGGANGFGIYAGSTIHEVAQVVAAARSVGPDAANSAVIAKMVRVMMLAPFLLTMLAWLARSSARHAPVAAEDGHAKGKLAVPWFAFGFVAVVLFAGRRPCWDEASNSRPDGINRGHSPSTAASLLTFSTLPERHSMNTFLRTTALALCSTFVLVATSLPAGAAEATPTRVTFDGQIRKGEITGFNKIRAISVTADGKTLFAANSGSNDIAVVDIAARRVTGTVPVGRDPYGAALTPDGRFIYSGNLADNTVSVIDVATLKVVATIAGFKQPRQAIVFTRDGRSAYVLNEDLSISKVDRSTQQITGLAAAPAV